MSITLSSQLRAEYVDLFNRCIITKAGPVAIFTNQILANRARYERLVASTKSDIPWWVVGLIHGLEANFSFSKHLHNGDSLAARTVQVPKGRPATGKPPFTWEESARDSLAYDGLTTWGDWTLAGALFKLEGYNGFGYRQYHPEVKSPYLWAASNHYKAGKYVADGKWSATAVSSQIGAAVALRRLYDLNAVCLCTCP